MKNSWIERFNKITGSEYPSHLLEIFINEEIDLAYQEGQDKKSRKYVSVSQWINYGKKYGYDKYLKQDLKNSILEWIDERKEQIDNLDGRDTTGRVWYKNALEDIKNFIKSEL